MATYAGDLKRWNGSDWDNLLPNPAPHTHNFLYNIDDRDVKPNNLSYNRIAGYFTSLEGLTGSAGSDYQDFLTLNTYSDSSGGKVNALAFDKSEMKIRLYQASQTDTTWGTPKTLAFSEDTVNLTGDQTIAGTKTFSSTITGTTTGNLTSSSTLSASKLSGAIPSAVTATTQATADNSTKIATTAYVKSQNYSTTKGTVTGVAMTVPTGLTVSGSPVDVAGTLALDVSFESGYSIPKTANQTSWNTAATATDEATSGNTGNTIVMRDASGNFSAGTITASLTGTASGNLTSSSSLNPAKITQSASYRFVSDTEKGNWNSAFGWGNHALAGYLTSLPSHTLSSHSDVSTIIPTTGQVLKWNGAAWAPSADNNSGTVTSVKMTVPTGLSISGSPITTSGTLAVTLTSGYSIPTIANQTKWSSAYTATDEATNANTGNTIVKRDASGNFSAGTITASLTGTASGNLTSASTLTASKLSGAIPSAVTATTQATADNSTKIATTAFVKAQGYITSLPSHALSSHSDVSTTAPTTGQVLKWNGSSWAPGTDNNSTYNLGSFGVTSTSTELNILDGATLSTAELNTLDGITATTSELNFTDGVTSNIQTQLNGKQATITGAATTIASSNLTASRALVSNASGKVAVSAVTSTELGYLDGVTSAIQTQLNTATSSISANTTAINNLGGQVLKIGTMSSSYKLTILAVDPETKRIWYKFTNNSGGTRYVGAAIFVGGVPGSDSYDNGMSVSNGATVIKSFVINGALPNITNNYELRVYFDSLYKGDSTFTTGYLYTESLIINNSINGVVSTLKNTTVNSESKRTGDINFISDTGKFGMTLIHIRPVASSSGVNITFNNGYVGEPVLLASPVNSGTTTATAVAGRFSNVSTNGANLKTPWVARSSSGWAAVTETIAILVIG